MNVKDVIKEFCKDADYLLIKYPNHKDDTEYGKILDKKEFNNIDYKHNEIYRSIKYVDDDVLFELNLIKEFKNIKYNPLDLLENTLDNARLIEQIFPNMFTWVFNGLNVVGYIRIPSGDFQSQGTISRYGGTDNFIRVLNRHLFNIIKLKDDKNPNYDFLNLTEKIDRETLSVGSKNTKTGFYSIPIDVNDSWINIIKQCQHPPAESAQIIRTRMKFWAREINPDFLVEAKRIKLENPLDLSYNVFDLYPAPIKRLINLKHKGNYNRFLLARFLLSVHSPKDAKFIYYSVLNEEELQHVKYGNCSTQWNFILNNMDRYDCPTMKELKPFIEEGDEPLSHPLEKIKKFMDLQKKNVGETK